MKKIEARKLEMTQVFTEDGSVYPVTVILFEKFPADLTPGTDVKVIGTSKGKGFAGVMKRHGFAGMPATHGRSTKGRAPGSIGGTTTPGRVYKGKKMAGRMGGERVTVRGLTVVEIDPEGKLAKLSGPLPGPRLSRLQIIYEPAPVVEEPAGPAPEVSEDVPEAETKSEEKKENPNAG